MKLRYLFLVFAMAIAPSMLHAQTASGGRAGGWHFYAPTPVKPPFKPPIKPEPISPTAAPTASPPVFSTAWLRNNIPQYLDRAIDNPTAQNIELYGLLQRLTMDRADRFASAVTRQAMFNPLLDQSSRNPVNSLARNANLETMSAAKKLAMAKVAQKAGLYYFFRSDCPYCHKQNPVLQMLEARTGIAVLPISLDARPSLDGAYPNFRPDQGQAAKWGVTVTPTLVYLSETGQSAVLATGIRALPELETRLLEMAFAQGAITAQEHAAATKGRDDNLMSLDGVPQEVMASAAKDPDLLLKLLRSGAIPGGSSAWTPNAITPQGGTR